MEKTTGGNNETFILALIVSCGKFNKGDFACSKNYPNKVSFEISKKSLYNYQVLHLEHLFYLTANIQEFDNLYTKCKIQ